jgi:hypothetical protein
MIHAPREVKRNDGPYDDRLDYQLLGRIDTREQRVEGEEKSAS